jgi:osmoprotectant transport system permease protein
VKRVILILFLVLETGAAPIKSAEKTLTIGSKYDIESEILGNMFAILARSRTPTTYLRLGGTEVAWQALVSGQIDAYPEYTGTLAKEIFATRKLTTPAQLEAALQELGLVMSRPLGFNNTYAVAMKEAAAAKLGIVTTSDLKARPELRVGFSNEFMGRDDGWPAMQKRYGLPFAPKGYEHALLYEALTTGALDAIEIYTTDSKVQKLQLRVLRDDLDFFPRYDAVVLARRDSMQRAPEAFQAILRLQGSITEKQMIELNEAVDERRRSAEQAAGDFVAQTLSVEVARPQSVWGQTVVHAREHSLLVAISLAAAIVLAVPLGVLSVRWMRTGQVVLAIVGILQTVPSLALLMFMIPLLGLGELPTIGALFLYSLLPIVRNTYTGIRDIPKELTESADALGLPEWTRLWRIELPLASRTILAGIKTAAVINVGTATIGGLIGAGGFGQPIVTGLQRNDLSMILWQGAVPAAVLAMLVQWLFDLAERHVVPGGLRLPPTKD